jgi:glucose/arabinose dehydrogenase
LRGTVVLVTSPPGDPRLFVLELGGAIRIIEDGTLREAPFLHYYDDPAFAVGGELGLLGLAFHPQYATNGLFYVFYTAANADPQDKYVDVLEERRVDPANPARALPERTTLLSIPNGFNNHNAGMIEFGPDGFLYISTGDGGSDASLPADPFGNAQNPQSLLGKMLRIDVDRPAGGKPYGIPPRNPYAAGGGAPEVWIRGLRNPWRWSFDRKTGDMWIADVGAQVQEEIDVLRPDQQAGANLGWSIWEGHNCYAAPCGDPAGLVFPQIDHPRADGFVSIIGGEVYRGSCYPDLVGTYVYTDLYFQRVMTAHLRFDGSVVVDPPGPFVGLPTSLHGDSAGELYVTSFGGDVFKIRATP